MFRDILSSRGIIFGLVFFVLIVGGALLYNWHVRRNSAVEIARTNHFLQQLRNMEETRTTPDSEFSTDTEVLGEMKTLILSDETQTRPGEMDPLPIDAASENFIVANVFLPESDNAEENVSPFGFGPYPEIPADFPHGASWLEEKNARRSPQRQRSQELICRVMIKAWTEGDRYFKGASLSGKDGKVYLHYPDRVYVQYGTVKLPNGEVIRRIVRAKGTNHNLLTPGQMRSGEVPHGVQAIPLESHGIDPQTYLNLPSSAF